MASFSFGAETIERVRMAPRSSTKCGVGRITSTYCPAVNENVARSASATASVISVVPSAIVRRAASVVFMLNDKRTILLVVYFFLQRNFRFLQLNADVEDRS